MRSRCWSTTCLVDTDKLVTTPTLAYWAEYRGTSYVSFKHKLREATLNQISNNSSRWIPDMAPKDAIVIKGTRPRRGRPSQRLSPLHCTVTEEYREKHQDMVKHGLVSCAACELLNLRM